ncbi:MAG TPA: hypothetical protein VGN59_15770 [Acidimicrobiia bacterium]
MAVPLPDAETVNLVPPDAAETEQLARAVATAAAGPGGITEIQRAVVNATVEAMSGYELDVAELAPLGPDEFAEVMRRRNLAFRERMVQVMLLLELLLVPLPPEVTKQVEEYAAALGVEDHMLRVTDRIARGSLGLALIDFERSGYFQTMLERPPAHLHTAAALDDAWQGVGDDPELAARWEALEHCPEGSLGRGVWRFYEARGFTFPGSAGSAPPTLAQHDWIHVLADFGSTVECEIEVFGFISRANDDPAAFALLAMVLGLFETGYLFNAAKGFFEYDRGHLSRDADRMAVRLADAMARGANAAWFLDDHGRDDETDFLATDWFEFADWSLPDVRRHFGVPAKSAKALAAGSVTPWEAGGISPFQYSHGREAAEATGREYDSYGATPVDG